MLVREPGFMCEIEGGGAALRWVSAQTSCAHGVTRILVRLLDGRFCLALPTISSIDYTYILHGVATHMAPDGV